MITNDDRPKVEVFIAMSLDGYIATKSHDLKWLDIVARKDEDYGFSEFYSRIDTLLIGRRTYDFVTSLEFWPYQGKQVVVASHRPIEAKEDEVTCSGSIDSILRSLKAQGAKSVYLDGGQMVQQGLAAGVIDGMTISIIPIVLGSGISLFGEMAQRIELECRGSQLFPSGLVQVKYGFKRQ
jgi:dihydrofolate reductase